MPIQARNNFVFILRDEAVSQMDGLYIPEQGQEKPHYGKIVSVGGTVTDKTIKAGQRAMFHKGNGWSMEYDGAEYVVIEGERIISSE